MAAGLVTSRDLTAMYLARIEAYDQRGPALNAISVINPAALDAKTDAERQTGKLRGRLHGIPVIVKDNYDTANMQTADGSASLKGWIPPDDAYLVRRLREAGAIIIAKANMHEFAYGVTTVGSLFGATRNPYALDRNPGGSSGGTGAAIAANFAAVGMGTDTCGSIRMPASRNNLVGIRGTQGLASRHGIIPLSYTLDIGGPMGRSVTESRSYLTRQWAMIQTTDRLRQVSAMFPIATPTFSGLTACTGRGSACSTNCSKRLLRMNKLTRLSRLLFKK
jgi:Asp-tRNA(Asn)/Glu-tRNA(Gln) amidotransferase A subunit family amidase